MVSGQPRVVKVSSRPSPITENEQIMFVFDLSKVNLLTKHYCFSQIFASALSLSGACQEDVAASTSVRHAGLSQAHTAQSQKPIIPVSPGSSDSYRIVVFFCKFLTFDDNDSDVYCVMMLVNSQSTSTVSSSLEQRPAGLTRL